MINRYTIEDAKQIANVIYQEGKANGEEYAKALFKELFKNPDNVALWGYIVLPHYFNREFKEVHYRHLDFLKIGKKKKSHRAVKAYRGEGKTSIQIVLQNTYEICHSTYDYIVFCSYSDTMTIDKIKLVKDEFEDNQMIRWLYGEPITDKGNWNKSDLEIFGKCRLKGISTGQSPRGLLDKGTRPNKILLDDVIDDEDVKNEDVRVKLIHWVKKALIPSIAKGGVVEAMNTPLHPDDLIEVIFRDEPPFHTWEKLQIDAEDENGNSVDEDWKTTDELMELKKDEYSYMQEFMNRPLLISSGLVKEEYLRRYDDLPKIKGQIYFHADTTHTGKQTSDYFAFGCMGQGVDGNFYLLDYKIAKQEENEQAKDIIESYVHWSNLYPVGRLTYDEKANQGFGYWIKKLAKEEYNISLPITELKYPNDKVTHFRPHLPHFIANRVYIPRNHRYNKLLLDQLLAFPQKGVHDDAVDMLSGLLDNFKLQPVITREKLLNIKTSLLHQHYYDEFYFGGNVVGDLTYYVILAKSNRLSDDEIHIFDIGILKNILNSKEISYNSIGDILSAYNVDCGVINGLPNKYESKKIVDQYSDILSMAFYTDDKKGTGEIWEDDNVVIVNKNYSLDEISNKILTNKFKINETWNDNHEKLALHFENCSRIDDGDNYSWSFEGEDYFVHALNFASVACKKGGGGGFYSGR